MIVDDLGAGVGDGVLAGDGGRLTLPVEAFVVAAGFVVFFVVPLPDDLEVTAVSSLEIVVPSPTLPVVDGSASAGTDDDIASDWIEVLSGGVSGMSFCVVFGMSESRVVVISGISRVVLMAVVSWVDCS
jgi:hypothetical protein